MQHIDVLIRNIGTVHTCAGRKCRRGSEMLDTSPVEEAVIAVSEDRILYIGPENEIGELKHGITDRTVVVNARANDVIPGFVDSHTHLIWHGDRTGEFARMLRGESYEDITAEGGGINTTVRATRQASLESMVFFGQQRLNRMLAHGTTSVECKSGYALETESELRMLEAVHILRERTPQLLFSTFLGAHLVPEEYVDEREEYVALVIDEMIPAVAAQGYADFCDVFMEHNAFNASETERILRAGIKHGLRPRLHADELSNTGAAALAARLGAASCDHLECISDNSLFALAKSNTVATLMPGVSFYLDLSSHAPFRQLYEAGCIIALATDFNPGTSPSLNMQGTFALGVLQMRMPVEVALTASTINAAYALDAEEETGSLEVGKRADIVVLDCSLPEMPYHWGENHAAEVICGGNLVEAGDLI
ncbi:MAG: imidazolonepropionase [Planctomycetota bacterium]|nr:imidazolonepropionase [Planctomycetota bacterium]